MDMIGSRNKSSHTYNKETACEIDYKIMDVYYPAFLAFRDKKKRRTRKDFLMENTGLPKDTIDSIRAVLAKNSELEKVLLYASRAMGNFKAASDINRSLIGRKIDLSLQNSIELELDDLMLPYKFDISIYHKTSNPKLLDHINRVGKEIYASKKSS